jgi:aminoglycoside phosphotransferase (APT) family kinase protein
MMNEDIPQEVITAFTSYTPGLPPHSAGKITILPVGGGLINHSYKVCCQLKCDFFLQKINTHVFTQPERVQQNYMQLWQFVEFEMGGPQMPCPQYWDDDKTLFTDNNGGYWRAFEWMENTVTHDSPQSPAQARATATAFADFTLAFRGMNTTLIQPVIPDFHNLSFRYQQFQDALDAEPYERMSGATTLIEELKARKNYVALYDQITTSAGFRLRVMHHDAKIANVLFHKTKGTVVCPVDFDTVMPGYFFSDLGDMIRSMAGREESSNGDNELNLPFYKAIVKGYGESMQYELTPIEKEHLHYAGPLMIYMQALRFLTDHLNGDQYYRIDFPGQNLKRALNQFSLLHSLEVYLKKENGIE